MKLKKIAEILKCRIFGDGDKEVYRLRDIIDAKEGDITIYFNSWNKNLIIKTLGSGPEI